MATVQEILDNALPLEIIHTLGYGYQSKAAFIDFCNTNGITEIPDSEITYRLKAAEYGYTQRPFNPNLTTRFESGNLKVSTRTELRQSSVSLPDQFFDTETGLIFKKNILDTTSEDDGISVIVSANGVRYSSNTESSNILIIQDSFSVELGRFKTT